MHKNRFIKPFLILWNHFENRTSITHSSPQHLQLHHMEEWGQTGCILSLKDEDEKPVITVSQHCQHQRWCTFFKLVFFSAERTQNFAYFGQFCLFLHKHTGCPQKCTNKMLLEPWCTLCTPQAQSTAHYVKRAVIFERGCLLRTKRIPKVLFLINAMIFAFITFVTNTPMERKRF